MRAAEAIPRAGRALPRALEGASPLPAPLPTPGRPFPGDQRSGGGSIRLTPSANRFQAAAASLPARVWAAAAALRSAM